MTELLVSVRDAEEARQAHAGGAAILDVKEPASGSLGRAAPETIRDVLDGFAGAAPVSAALGELTDADACDFRTVDGRLAYAKIGLARAAGDGRWRERLTQAMEALPATVGRVAVAYADWRIAEAPAPEEVIEFAGSTDCAAVLLDTFEKRAGTLLEVAGFAAVRAFVEQARTEGLRVVVAGSLDAAAMRRLLPLAPDYFGVRGAACGGVRDQPIVASCVARLVAEVDGCNIVEGA